MSINTIMILIHSFAPRLRPFLKIITGFFFQDRPGAVTLGILISAMALTPASGEIHRLRSDEMTLFQRISSNAEQRRPTMKLDPILCLVARQRAADMARRGYFDHVNPDGHGANYLVRRAGFLLPAEYDSSRSGNNIESIGMSTGSPRQIAALWLKSPAHRVHVLGELGFYEQQTAVGVGIVRSSRPPHFKYHVFLSAPPNASPRARAVILKSPKGKTITSTWNLAAEWARITGTADQ
ncbi:MAG: CAP domain-containing protein [Verrucomicrobiota bacterium]